MKIEIKDESDSIISDTCDEVKSAIMEFLEENPEHDEAPELHDQFNYSGRFDEIIDSSVPIYTYDIDAFWYCNKYELQEVYENHMGGGNPMENNGMTAIYLFIQDKVTAWYDGEKDEIFEQWQADRLEKIINSPVKSHDQAIILFTILRDTGKTYHPEDDANSTGIFSEEEGKELNKRMKEIYGLPWKSHLYGGDESAPFDCPCDMALSLN